MKKSRIKILFGGFGLESSTFTPLIASADQLIIQYRNQESPLLPSEIGEFLADQSVDLIETMRVLGAPSGCIPLSDFQNLSKQFLKSVQEAGPIDGILLSMHGSMLISDGRHGELELLRALRVQVGEDIPIAVRLDLHGNIPAEMVRYAEIFSALRTAPHRDGVETLLRTARLLLRCIKEGLRPRSYWVKVPLLLPGECVITEIEPGRSLYNLLDDADKTPGVLCSSIMVGFAWADTPWTTSGIIVSGTDRDACHSTAIRLAKSFWDMRHQFQVEGESCSISEALERASVSATRPVFISDSGDNITAGAPGETINFLADVRRIKAGRILYAQIYSPKGVITCQEHAIGEKLTIRFGDAVLEGVIKSVTNGSIDIVSRTEAFTVVLFQTPYMDLLITDKRFPIVDPARFIQYGAPLLNYDIVIFKLGYLMPELRDIATRHIMAISEGCTTLDLKSLSYKRLAEPLFPRRDNFEPDFKVNPD